MKKLLVFALIILLAVPVVLTGCGQKQEAAKKPDIIKPSVNAAESADTDEEDASAPAKDESQGPAAESAAIAPKTEEPVVEAPKQAVAELVIADFDSGEKPNNLGGNFGAWNKDPSDPTQWCKESFDNVARHGDKGFSMKLNYSVESPNPAYNGFWMMLPNFDASSYDDLTFWVKGDPKEGYTTVFKVELKNASKQVGRYYVSNVSDQWQKITIPLSELRTLPDRSNLTELVIVFEDRMASNKKGAIYLDDFKFIKNK
jgi:hypothetical protein